MTIQQSVELMLKSSDYNPYSGKLSKKDNIIAAIDLAKLCKEFADKGQMDEAMHLDGNHWQKVVDELNTLK